MTGTRHGPEPRLQPRHGPGLRPGTGAGAETGTGTGTWTRTRTQKKVIGFTSTGLHGP